MDFNYLEAHIFRVTSVLTPAQFELASQIPATELAYIGIMQQETGYMIEPEHKDKSTVSDDKVLSYKLTANLNCLVKLDTAAKALLDGKNVALLFASPDNVTVNADGSQITISGTPQATLLTPLKLYIKEDNKYGSGKVAPVNISGDTIKETKAELHKTVTLRQQTTPEGAMIYGEGKYGENVYG